MDVLKKCVELVEQGKALVLMTVMHAEASTPAKEGFKMIVTEEHDRFGTVGGGALEQRAIAEAEEVLSRRKNSTLRLDLAAEGMECGGSVVVTLEYFQGGLFFVLFGGGHVASALAPVLESIGFRVIVFDNREEILEHHRSEGRTVIYGDFSDIAPTEPYLRSGFCCIATQGHQFDTTILRRLLQSNISLSYIGMIGSKRKVKTALADCKRDGLAIPSSLYAPVGLPVGGDTVSEIAVSIASEVLSVRYEKAVPHMRDGIME